MTQFTPVYRATVYAADGVTPLTPIGGAPHSDEFQGSDGRGRGPSTSDRDSGPSNLRPLAAPHA